ncbi:MAG: hypothetical protein A2275_17975 [Bacteroidetes bacterium RIFOXYA12_FULL_35_11]|nr:MAG: hypothetical protein A2X01_04700 [Bacteroidetes bacterium GWF2_35_48]OFY72482.1 MAG: hypothetical protein A2275_17975 [Bacteroidetes bacterium RIFOXYA12_FULL_35_11]OFZ00924.1 MAG: hypothetical protein A2491_04060 [Bacteroidetes bacterium RIFOXYC12_FULL_35_7]
MFSRIIKSDFNKNVFTLMLGTVSAQLITLALYPIFSRIFSPSHYALFGIYFSIFSILEVVSSGRYELAVVVPEKDEEAKSLVVGGLIISAFVSLFFFIIALFFRNNIAILLHNEGITDWLLLLPFGLFLISVSKLFNSWLIRKKAFRASSINKVAQKIGEGGTGLILGLNNISNGLVWGDFAGRASNALISIKQAFVNGFSYKKTTKTNIWYILRRFSDYPVYNALPALINSISGMLPVFIVSSFYGEMVSGYFNFTRFILTAPFAFIVTSLSQVLSQRIAEKCNKNESILEEIKLLAKRLSIISILLIIILYFGGPFLFGIVFSSKWIPAGEYATILCFSYAITLVVSPFTIILASMEKIKILTVWQLIYFIMILSLFWFAKMPIHHFLIAITIIEILAYTFYAFLLIRVLTKYEKNISHINNNKS